MSSNSVEPAPTSFDLSEIWSETFRALTENGADVPPAQREWLRATTPVGFSDNMLILAAPNTFARNWLEQHLGDQIRRVVGHVAGIDISVVITVQTNPTPIAPDQPAPPPRYESWTIQAPADGSDVGKRPERDGGHGQPVQHHAQPSAPPASGQQASAPRSGSVPSPDLIAPGRPPGPTVQHAPIQRREAREHVGSTLNPKYRFETFVVGPSNQLPNAAAVAVSEAPAKSYNPLFIYGSSGLGKTHLLHAIGHYVRDLYPRLRVCYVTTEQFTNEFIAAIQAGESSKFQRRYREVDVLMVDDIQFLEGKQQTQEEFFHTFNALNNAEKQIVISSDRPPNKLARLEERLRSRFAWGLLTDVQPPELETRIAILSKKVHAEGMGISRDVIEFIASRVQSNIRELEGALIRMTAYASLHQKPIDLAAAEAVLKDVFPTGGEQPITAAEIMSTVATYYGLTVDDLTSRSRSRHLVNARHMAMYLVREFTQLSLPQIGKQFGGRDHTTVMNAKDKIAQRMQTDQQIYDAVQDLTNRLKTGNRG